ncbi:MAG: KilA-N domain-containing protein [Cyanobacteria bacterium P01_E01_bin.6]
MNTTAPKAIISFFDQFPEWNGYRFEFRGTDGYANITHLNKALGKRFTDWRKTNFAKELLDELSKIYRAPIDWENSPSQSQKPLIDYVRGGDAPMFVHPAVALSYCTSNPRLQARLNAWVVGMMTTGTANPRIDDWNAMEYLRGVQFNRDDITDMYG